MDYLSIRELAEMQLSGLPTTERRIREKAKKENWQCRKRQGRGGGMEYAVSSLPQPIQQAITAKQTADLLAQARQPETSSPATLPAPQEAQLPLSLESQTAALNQLTHKQKNCASARCAIVQDILHTGNALGFSRKRAIAYFLEQLHAGTLPERLSRLVGIANARNNNQRMVSPRTLASWVDAYVQSDKDANRRLLALSPAATKLERSPFAENWLPRFVKWHKTPQKPALAHSYERFKAQWLADGLPANELPSLRKVHRVWNKLPKTFREQGRSTGQAYLTLLPYVKRDWHVLQPNQVWIVDGHSFKARVKHRDHGQPYVPEITLVVDGCTRKILGFSITTGESSKAVADALRMALKHGGLPVLIYSDNGKGETGRDITGELTGFCPRLDIEHKTGTPGRAQGRGIIEGLWDITLIKQAKTYASYHGKDMDKSAGHLMYRKTNSWANAEMKGKALSDEQRRYQSKMPSFQQFFADLLAVLDEYNAKPHSAHPKKPDGVHFSPNEYWDYRMAQLPIEQRPEQISEEEMRLLERSMEARTVQRGWIQFNHAGYFNTALAPYDGQKLLIAYDWDDASHIEVYQPDGRFVCTAQLNGNTRAAFENVDSMADTQRKKRVAKQIRLKQNQIQRIQMDADGGNTIEHTPDFAQILPSEPVPANEHEFDLLDRLSGGDEDEYSAPPQRQYFNFG